MDQSIDLLADRDLDPESAAAIDRKIEEHAEWSFQYLERLVAARSTVGQEQSALEIFATEMHALGFSIERLPIPEDIVSVPGSGIPMASYSDRYDVVARRTGDIDGASLLLNGHIDVVPADEPQLWTNPPFQPQRRDGWLYGRGAGDMKCGFAMGALALRAILDVDVEAALGPLTFVAAIEEEYTGNGTLASVDAGVLADAVVILEPTNLDLLLGAVGILWLEIEVEGRAAHAESAAMAVNAIEAALPLVATLHELEAELNSNPDPRIDAADPLHVNLGRFRGGDWPSSVPSVARLDIRVAFPLGWTPDQAEALVREHIARASARDPWLADHLPRIRCSGFRAEGYDLPHHHPLALSLAAAHRHAHGDDPATIRMASTTDARTYLNQAGVPAICYGPRTERIHGIDEGVELASILAGARTLARFLVAFPGSYRVP